MKILFSSSPHFIPIIRNVLQNNKILIYQEHFKKMLGDLDIETVYLGNLLSGDVVSRSLQESAKIVADVINNAKDFAKPEYAVRFFEQSVIPHVYQRVSEMVSTIVALDISKPDIVVLHNDVEPHTRLIALWAKTRDVPCIHIPHSIYMGIEKGKKDIHNIGTASHAFVASEYQKQYFLNNGYADENVLISGLPQFDKYAKPIMSRERAYKLLKLNPQLPTITYASSWRQDTNLLGCHDGVEQTYKAFLSAMQKLKRVQVIVKTHPHASQESLQWHMSLAKEYGVDCTVTPSHLEVVLLVTDLLFAYGGSNILLDASFYQNVRMMTTHGYDDDNEVLCIGSEAKSDDIVGAMKNLLSQYPKDLQGFRKKYVGYDDGFSHMRIAEFIKSFNNDS